MLCRFTNQEIELLETSRIKELRNSYSFTRQSAAANKFRADHGITDGLTKDENRMLLEELLKREGIPLTQYEKGKTDEFDPLTGTWVPSLKYRQDPSGLLTANMVKDVVPNAVGNYSPVKFEASGRRGVLGDIDTISTNYCTTDVKPIVHPFTGETVLCSFGRNLMVPQGARSLVGSGSLRRSDVQDWVRPLVQECDSERECFLTATCDDHIYVRLDLFVGLCQDDVDHLRPSMPGHPFVKSPIKKYAYKSSCYLFGISFPQFVAAEVILLPGSLIIRGNAYKILASAKDRFFDLFFIQPDDMDICRTIHQSLTYDKTHLIPNFTVTANFSDFGKNVIFVSASVRTRITGQGQRLACPMAAWCEVRNYQVQDFGFVTDIGNRDLAREMKDLRFDPMPCSQKGDNRQNGGIPAFIEKIKALASSGVPVLSLDPEKMASLLGDLGYSEPMRPDGQAMIIGPALGDVGSQRQPLYYQVEDLSAGPIGYSQKVYRVYDVSIQKLISDYSATFPDSLLIPAYESGVPQDRNHLYVVYCLAHQYVRRSQYLTPLMPTYYPDLAKRLRSFSHGGGPPQIGVQELVDDPRVAWFRGDRSRVLPHFRDPGLIVPVADTNSSSRVVEAAWENPPTIVELSREEVEANW
jgi:hypothetical protein